jgi:hypothetical protein
VRPEKSQSETQLKHIGSGWQFDAYVQGDLVIKLTTSPFRMATRVLRSYPTLVFRLGELKRKVEGLVTLRSKTLAQLAQREIDTDLIANFRQENGRYVQDRLTPLAGALKEGRDPYWLMDRYIESIRAGWRSGFAETSFNFTVNHGLTERGRVVVLDVGEMSFDRGEVERIIEDRLWERSFSMLGLPPDVRVYLLERMDRLMNTDRLIREWRDARITRALHRAPDRPAQLPVRSNRKKVVFRSLTRSGK